MSLEKRILGWLTIGLIFFATIKIFWPNADTAAWNGLVSFSKKLSSDRVKKEYKKVTMRKNTTELSKSSDQISFKFIKLYEHMRNDIQFIHANNEKLAYNKVLAACEFVHLCNPH